jgi:UDP-glucuronate 4-epimerase
VRVIVTGATGFVGRHLVPALAQDHETICIVRDARGATSLGTAALVEADLSRSALRRRLPAQADRIIHLAQAYVPFPKHATEIFAVNAASTQRLAEYARQAQVSRFIFASSGSVYRPSRRPLRENAPTVPAFYHPATKLMSEMVLRYYQPYFSIAVLRLFAPYGPGQVNRLIPRMIAAVRSGAVVALSRGGEPRINPIYVDDLVQVIRQSLGNAGSYTVNVAGSRVVGMRQLAGLVGRQVGRRPKFIRSDSDVAGDLIADTHLMHELFTLKSPVTLDEGLARVMASERGPSR